MVVSWSHLLPELWFIVFKHVQSIKTVAECRLVCKTWNPLAESAMVGKSLSLNSEERIVKFCNRLQENPSLRYYIRSLSFGFSPYMSELFTKDFFKLVMNPNIVSLDGWFDETDLNNLFNAVKESGEQYKKLESLISRQPWQNIRMGDIYLSVQLYFKTSLKDLCLSLLDTPHTPIYQTVVDHLDQFINLKKLIIRSCNRHVLPELERMLRQCQLLESIDIIADVDFGIPRISKDDLKQWMINNVQQLPSLQSADINSYDHPHLVDYLIFKCPRMRNLALSNIEIDDHGTVGRIVDAIKNVYSLNLDCWRLGNATDAEHVLSILKNRNNSIILRPCQSGDISGLLMALNAKKNREDNTTHCAICISETDFPEEVDLPEILNRIIKAIAPFPNFESGICR